MEKKGNDFVTVSVRMRPNFNQNTSSCSCIQVISKEPPVVLLLDKAQTYHFDNVFTEEYDQQTIYNTTVKTLVEKVKTGYNSTVFAYGQTGTGKTYTIGTDPNVLSEDLGLISRTLDDFFQPLDHQNFEIEIFLSFIEIYNEKVFDLLTGNSEKRNPLPVKGFSVQGFNKLQVYNTSQAKNLLKMGSKNRHTGETRQNTNSSRSHAVFTVYCHKRDCEKEIIAKLNLVDLAGSESIRKTGNQGSSLHEGININKGLLNLGQVIAALSDKHRNHVPYRQSVLTTILQDSLNKKNFISLIACVSCNSEDSVETFQTLQFAHELKKLKNKPEVNQFILQYKKENPALFVYPRGYTPKKSHSLYETPFKRPRIGMSTIQEPDISNSDSPKSLHSISMSTILSDVCQQPQNFSPIVKKYVDAMEEKLVSRLGDVIKNTLETSIMRNDNKENTPSFSWNKVSSLVRSEILQFTSKVSRATSSPIELNCSTEYDSDRNCRARKILEYDTSVSEHGTPEEKTEINTSKGEKSALQTSKDDNVFKIPQAVPKKTIKVKKDQVSQDRRRSIRLEQKQKRQSYKETIDTTENSRRSMRLESKLGQRNNIPKKNIVETVPKRLKEVKKGKKQIDSPITARSKQILNILNTGTQKELEKLHTVGSKTADKIFFFREVTGHFESITELSKMPTWTKAAYQKFLKNNFITDNS